jgi:hypothetical protein
MKFQKTSLLLASLLLAGCASLNAEYGHKDGWRPGTVKRVGDDQEMRERLSSTCANTPKSKSFALIQYTGNSHLRWRAFPVPEGVTVAEGDKVDLNVNECKFSLAK